MKAADVRDLSDDELSAKLLELKKEAFNLRFQGASGQLEKTARVREVRRDVARVKTIMGQRAAAKAPADTQPAPSETIQNEGAADA